MSAMIDSIQTAVNTSTANHSIYFDWPLSLRAGGPPGYLANLRKGLVEAGLANKVDFIVDDSRPFDHGTTKESSKRVAAQRASAPLIQRVKRDGGSGDEGGSKVQKLGEEYLKQCEFLCRHDWFHVTPDNLRRLNPQARYSVHVHTTIDAIKVHNALTNHGARHCVKLILTSHAPEIPAKEWAEQAFANGVPAEIAELYFLNHREVDYMAFHYADVLIFPCREAMEPYYSTIPDYEKLFGQRDVRFVPTGAAEMPVTQSKEEMRTELGLGKEFVACFIGRHNQVKGFDVLSTVGLDLMKQHEDIAFLIGGRPGPIPSPTHPRWIEYGWTDTPGNLVSASDVFVLPNQQTYFDLIFLEVLSTGRMIIASRTGGNRYFEGLSEGILLYDTPEELAATLLHVRAMSTATRKRCGSSNRRLYEERFTLEKFARNYVSVIDGIHHDFRVASPSKLKQLGTVPDISVIVPVYNVESFLEDCLTSIENQTLRDIEVLVVNDGSTDGSRSIIQKFVERDPRFVCIDRENGGLSAARNSGLDRARGRYISFVDSDDYIRPTMLEKLLVACEQNGTRLAVCGVAHLNTENEIANRTGFLADDLAYPFWKNGMIEINSQTVTSIYPSAWNKLYEASVFDRLRYDAGLYYEDHPVFYKAFLQEKRFSYVSEPLYVHRDSGVGRITRDGSRRAIDIFAVLDTIESVFRSRFLFSEVREVMAKLITRLIWERSWVVGNHAIRFLLMENAMMRYNRWRLSSEEIRFRQDRVIAPDFIDDVQRTAEWFDGWDSPKKRLISLDHLVSVKDSSAISNRFEFPLVTRDEDEGFILVHPQTSCTTVAEVSGFGCFGSGRLSLSVCTENELADDIEFRVVVAPFRQLLSSKLDVPHDPHWLAATDWMRLSPEISEHISLKIENCSPTMMLYFCSRVPAGSEMHHAWTRVRHIVLSLDLEER